MLKAHLNEWIRASLVSLLLVCNCMWCPHTVIKYLKYVQSKVKDAITYTLDFNDLVPPKSAILH